MLSLRKPSPEVIRRFLTAQAKRDLSYSAVGATATTPPAGHVVDHTRVKLGEGEAVFRVPVGASRFTTDFGFARQDNSYGSAEGNGGGLSAAVGRLSSHLLQLFSPRK